MEYPVEYPSVSLCARAFVQRAIEVLRRESPLRRAPWSVRLRPRGAHTSFLSGRYVGPRLLVTRQERSRKRKPPGAQPARGLCLRYKWGPGPGPEVRALTGKRLPTPAKREPGRDSESGARGSRCGTCSSASSAPRAGVTGRFRQGSLRILHARPGQNTKPAPGFGPSAPLVPVALPEPASG